MKPIICQIKHDPPNTYGDCLRACIASLFDLTPDRVIHFSDAGISWEQTVLLLRAWLKEFSLGIWFSQYAGTKEEILALHAELNPGIYYLLFSADHVVICQNDKIVHDPAWYRTPLTPPIDVWTVGVIARL